MPNAKGKRSANGAGTIRHRSDGLWEGIMTLGTNTKTGKPLKKSVYGKTQKQVRLKMTEMRDRMDKNMNPAQSAVTVQQWANTWLNDFCKNLKPLTLKAYILPIQHYLIPYCGKIRLKDLTTLHLQKMFNDMNDNGLKPISVSRYKTTISTCLNKAVDLEYLFRNPCDKVTIKSVPKSKINILPKDKLEQFIDEAYKTSYGDILFLCLFTGLRIGQAIGLPWNNVNFDNNTILIAQQYHKYKGQDLLYTPKWDKARTIYPSPSVMNKLKQIRDTQLQLAKEPTYNNRFGFVFTNCIGEPIIYHTVYLNYKRICRKIGYPDLRLHDLRHTYATNSIELGSNIKSVSESLGHASIDITGDIYVHATESMQRAGADRMQTLIDSVNHHQ